MPSLEKKRDCEAVFDVLMFVNGMTLYPSWGGGV